MLARKIRSAALVAVTGLLALFGGGVAVGLAQDATPQPPTAPRTAHLHRGTCADVDPSPYLPLTDVVPSAGDLVGASSAIPVAMSVTRLEVSIEELRAAAYVIDVHESADAAAPPVACGAIGGAIGGVIENELVIGLQELNGSGAAGIVRLRADGERTDVIVYLTGGPTGPARGDGSEQVPASEETVTLSVPTITCASCSLRVEASIRKAPGILDVAFDGQDVTVTYDPSQVSPAEIATAIEAGGDTVEPTDG